MDRDSSNLKRQYFHVVCRCKKKKDMTRSLINVVVLNPFSFLNLSVFSKNCRYFANIHKHFYITAESKDLIKFSESFLKRKNERRT